MPSAIGGLVRYAPIALLALVVAGIALRPPAPVDPADRAVRDSVLHDVGARGARHLVDAYRFATGELPATLDDARAWEDPATAMAAPEAAPYYYVQRGRSFVLLAPEQPQTAARRLAWPAATPRESP